MRIKLAWEICQEWLIDPRLARAPITADGSDVCATAPPSMGEVPSDSESSGSAAAVCFLSGSCQAPGGGAEFFHGAGQEPGGMGGFFPGVEPGEREAQAGAGALGGTSHRPEDM